MRKLTIYTDGGYSMSRNQGGAAFIIVEDDKVVYKHTQAYVKTTSQRMELLAVINALSVLKERCDIVLYTDSQYVVNTLTLGWNKKFNTDLWDKIDELLTKQTVKFVWVKGHSDNKFNNECDKLATISRNLKLV